MKADELDEALERPDYSPEPPAPPKPSPLGASVLVQDQHALNMAHKFGLIRADGSIKCIRDYCNGNGQLPSLECPECRRRRVGEAQR